MQHPSKPAVARQLTEVDNAAIQEEDDNVEILDTAHKHFYAASGGFESVRHTSSTPPDKEGIKGEPAKKASVEFPLQSSYYDIKRLSSKMTREVKMDTKGDGADAAVMMEDADRVLLEIVQGRSDDAAASLAALENDTSDLILEKLQAGRGKPRVQDSTRDAKLLEKPKVAASDAAASFVLLGKSAKGKSIVDADDDLTLDIIQTRVASANRSLESEVERQNDSAGNLESLILSRCQTKEEIKEDPILSKSSGPKMLRSNETSQPEISMGEMTNNEPPSEREVSDRQDVGTGNLIRPIDVHDDGPPGAYTVAPGEVPLRLSRSDMEDLDLSDIRHSFVNNHTAGGNDGLAVAQPVDEESFPEITAEAQELTTRKRRSSKGCAWLLIGAALLAVVTVVPVVVILGRKENTYKKEPTASPSSSETLPWALALPNRTKATILDDDGSPQAKAYQWLQEDPYLSTYSETRMLQRFALATLYHSTNGEGWVSKKGWLRYDAHECYDWASFVSWLPAARFVSWLPSGVARCNEDEEYTALVLPQNGLIGTLPPELGLLWSLRVMVLGGNHLGGPVPSQIWGLSYLGMLTLNSNFLTGTLEPEMFHAIQHEMVWLDLHDNMFKGTIPTELGVLQATIHLGLNDNLFTGTIATELGQMISMESIALSANGLTGSIPSEIFLGWERLTHLEFRENPITGAIPSQIGLLSSLKGIFLYKCRLSGQIPSETGLLFNMTHFVVSHNLFSGPMPQEFWRLHLLQDFNIGNDAGTFDLTGSIPTEVGLLKDLARFDNSGSRMSGSIPSQLGLLTRLYQLGLKGTGTVPNEIWDLPALTYLALDDSITGTIPEDPKAFNGLSYLFIYSSSLVGTISGPICALSSEQVFLNCSESLCGCSCSCAGPP